MPEQIVLQGQIGVVKTNDGMMLTMDVGGGRVYTIQLTADVAKDIGQALVAPSVAMPGNGRA